MNSAGLRASGFKTYRFNETLCQRIESVAALLGGVSENHVAEQCVRQMLDLMDAPAERRVIPALVALVDAARAHAQHARPLASAPVSSAPPRAPADRVAAALLRHAVPAPKRGR